MDLNKRRAIKVEEIRQSARGQECQVRIPGVCNFDPETTVLAHLNGGGAGMKKDDVGGASYACSSCHDVLDGRVSYSDGMISLEKLQLYHREGVEKTIRILIDLDLVVIPGWGAA